MFQSESKNLKYIPVFLHWLKNTVLIPTVKGVVSQTLTSRAAKTLK